MNELATQAQDPLSAILADPKQLKEIPIETVERLFALKERHDDRQAEREFNSAFVTAQLEMSPVKKLGKTHVATYAKAEDVKEMLDPIIAKHGFSYSISEKDSKKEDHIRFNMKLRHIGGHSENYWIDVKPDITGAKGGSSKTYVEGIMSSYTLCMRQLLCKVWAVQLIDDDDGKRAGGFTPLTHDQALDLNERMDEVLNDMQKAKMLEVLGVEKIETLASSQYVLAKNMIESKRK